MPRSLLEMMQPQYYLPQEQQRAGNWPLGYFGDKSPSGTPYPGTLYMEMVRQTEDAQKRSPAMMPRFNREALLNFMANAPRSTNIEDRRGEQQPDPSEPDAPVAEEVYRGDPNNSLARALGYGALDPVPMPRPRPRR